MCRCVFERHEKVSTVNWKLRCKVCGFITGPTSVEPESFHAECKSGERDDIKIPSMAVRAFNFAKAYAEHVKNGKKECTQRQIEERFEECRACPAYTGKQDGSDAGDGSCMFCGCYVNNLPASEGLNKLAWAEQECPYKNEDGEKQPKWLPIKQLA